MFLAANAEWPSAVLPRTGEIRALYNKRVLILGRLTWALVVPTFDVGLLWTPA